MKRIFLILLLFYSIFLHSQYKVFEEKKNDTILKINYSNIMYKKTKGIDPILNLYVFIDTNNQNINKEKIRKFILKNKIRNSIFYFVESSSHYKTNVEKEHFFLSFMCKILSEKKMIDSDLIIISNKNITNQYESERLKKIEFEKNALEKNFNESNLCKNYLNEINKLIINPDLNEIYKILTKR